MIKRLALCAAALATLATAAAAPQDPWAEQVRRILTEGGKELENNGFSLTQRIYTGALDEGATETVELPLEAGTEYYIVGACDQDCTDLDMTLMDASGRQLDIDTQPDDFPIVHVTPARAGTFRAVVSMATCSEAPCRFGVGIYGK
ncbi:MAG TPA: hypothetical protein VHG91_07105 [Longimicrobium sp.]|nr:hypothetical protein [Longimicrobium sp.]